MFLFPWLHWGIDISDFEKIDFLAHEPYLAFLASWKGVFLGPQVEFRPHSGGVEYSTCLKIFIFWKYNVSAFKWRVERFSTTLKEKKRLVYEKKAKKTTLRHFLTGASLIMKKFIFFKKYIRGDHMKKFIFSNKNVRGDHTKNINFFT